MTVKNMLAIGEEDEKGAFLVIDDKRDPKIEEALRLILEGSSTREAGKAISMPESTLIAHIGKNTQYVEYYARAKVAKGISLIEGLLDQVEGIENQKGINLEALRIKIDVHKWVAGKYAPHFGKALEESNLVNSPSNNTPVININIAPVNPLDNTTQVIDVEGDKEG